MARVVTVHPTDAPCQDLRPHPARSRQPWLHELEVAVRGPVTCLSMKDGDVAAALPGARRPGCSSTTGGSCTPCGSPSTVGRPSAVAAASSGGTTETYGVARHLGDPGPDPTVEVARRRVLHDRGLRETVTVRNRWSEAVSTRVEVRVAGDGAELHDVKHGVAEPTCPPVAVGTTGATWSDDRHVVLAHGDGATTTSDDEGALLVWDVEVPAAGEVEVVLDVRADRTAPTPFDTESGFAAVDLDGIRVIGAGRPARSDGRGRPRRPPAPGDA